MLGVLRVLLLVPRLGVRRAELLGLPVMVLASFLVARWLLQRRAPFTQGQCLGIGLLALAALLCAEAAGMAAQGMSLRAYIAGRDPVSGSAYLLALLAFAAMPLLAGRGDGGL